MYKPYVVAVIFYFLIKSVLATEFDFSHLHNISQDSAQAMLSRTHTIYEIKHPVSVIVNGSFLGVRKIWAVSNKGSTCVSQNAFDGLAFSKVFWQAYYNKKLGCLVLDEALSVSSQYEFSSQKVLFSFPQTALQTGEERDIEWDFGQNGFNVFYNANAASTHEGDISSYLSADIRVNLNKWRFLANGYTNNEETEFDEFLLKRDLPSIKSRLHIGNTYLPSDSNSFSFDGVILSSEDGYRTWAEDRYIPVISGIANSTSRIEVKQNDRIVFSEIIQAGPYEYSEYTIFGSGQLTVTVTDQAGIIDTTIYPVTLSSSIKPIGSSSYNLAVGDNTELESGFFVYGDYIEGFNEYTLGVNALVAEKYQSIGSTLALGFNYWGALSISIDSAFTQSIDSMNGLRYKLDYSNSITENMTFGIVNMGYQDKEYRTFSENENTIENDEIIKSNVSINLNSQLYGNNSVYISGYLNEYWSEKKEQGVNLGYSNRIGRVSMSLNGNYSVFDGDSYDDSWGLSASLSIPLGEASTSPSLSTTYTNNNSSQTYTASLSANPSDKTSYNLSTSYSESDHETTNNISVTHEFAAMNTSASIGDSKSGDVNWSGSVSGSVVKIADSPVTFHSRQLSSAALIKVGEEDGVKFRGSNVESYNGLMLVSLNEMSSNKKSIDSSSLDIGTKTGQLVYHFDATSDALFYRTTEVFKSTPAIIDIDKKIFIPIGALVLQGAQQIGLFGMDNLSFIRLINKSENIWIANTGGEKICEININDIDFKEIKEDEVPLYMVECVQ